MATAKTRLIRCRLAVGGGRGGQRVGPLEHPAQHRGQDDGGDGQVAHGQQAGGDERHHRHHVPPAQPGPDQQEQGQDQEDEGEPRRRALEVGRHPLDDPLERLPLVAQGEGEDEQLGPEWVDHRHHQPHREPAHVAHGVRGARPASRRPRPRARAPSQARPRGNEPWLLTHSHTTGISSHWLRRLSTMVMVSTMQMAPKSRGRGVQNGEPMPDDDEPAEGGAQRRAGPHQADDQPRQQGDEQGLLEDHQPEAAQALGPAVGPFRQPALDHPLVAGGGEGVGVDPGDAQARDHVDARADVGEHRVVADRPHAEAEAEQHERGDEERFEARRGKPALDASCRSVTSALAQRPPPGGSPGPVGAS